MRPSSSDSPPGRWHRRSALQQRAPGTCGSEGAGGEQARAVRRGGDGGTLLTPAEVAAARATTLGRPAQVQGARADTAGRLPREAVSAAALPARSLGQAGASIDDADDDQRVGRPERLGGGGALGCRHSAPKPCSALPGPLQGCLAADCVREKCKTRLASPAAPALRPGKPDQVAWTARRPEFRPAALASDRLCRARSPKPRAGVQRVVPQRRGRLHSAGGGAALLLLPPSAAA